MTNATSFFPLDIESAKDWFGDMMVANHIDSGNIAGLVAHFLPAADRLKGLFETGAMDGATGFNPEALADTLAALDLSGSTGQALRLYQAAFDRAPDTAGLKYWTGFLDGGGSLADAAAGFIDSPEFEALYGANPNISDLVTKFYNNVLDRAPEQAGLEYWMHQLDAGLQSVPAVLAHFSESPENQANLIDIVGSVLNHAPWHASQPV